MSYDQIGKIIHTFILRTFKYTYVTNSKKPFVQLSSQHKHGNICVQNKWTRTYYNERYSAQKAFNNYTYLLL